MLESRAAYLGSAVFLPIFAGGLSACTLGGLAALSAGSPVTNPLPDSSTMDSAAAEDSSVVDASTAPTVDAAQGIDSTVPVDAGPPSDAPPNGDSASIGDGSADGAVLDAATPSDGGADAHTAEGGLMFVQPTRPGYPPDASTPGWCDNHVSYTFCADFDKYPVQTDFSGPDGPYLFQTSDTPNSPPNDMVLYVPSMANQGTFGAKISNAAFAAVTSSISLAFDIRPEFINTTASGLLFAAIEFTDNANAKYSLRLAYDNQASRLEESYLQTGGADIYHAAFALPLAQWSRLSVDISFGTTNDAGSGQTSSSESISVNGVVQEVEMLTPPATMDRRPSLLIGGVFGTSPTDGWIIRYDNVTLDIH